MALLSKEDFEGYSIALWKIEEDENELVSMISNMDRYVDELQKFKSVSRRREWLSVRALLDSILNGEKIVYKSSGKPYLESDNFNISVSHTLSYVSIIFSKTKEVAIDIEKYGQRVQKVASRFIREDEKLTPYNDDMIWPMLIYWSAKESAFKMFDIEGIDFLKHFRISSFISAKEGDFLLEETKTSQKKRLTVRYRIFDDFVMTWSVK